RAQPGSVLAGPGRLHEHRAGPAVDPRPGVVAALAPAAAGRDRRGLRLAGAVRDRREAVLPRRGVHVLVRGGSARAAARLRRVVLAGGPGGGGGGAGRAAAAACPGAAPPW